MIMSIKRFTYKKKDGSVSDRVVYVTSPASDCDLGLDLTEFEPEEVKYYCEELFKIHAQYTKAVTELGLGKNWRKFKVEGIL
jgi:hypothetical protein